jgi:hypothetical protein
MRLGQNLMRIGRKVRRIYPNLTTIRQKSFGRQKSWEDLAKSPEDSAKLHEDLDKSHKDWAKS